MLNNLILIILVLHMLIHHFLILAFCHILYFEYNQLQHLILQHLLHFVSQLQIYLVMVHMLFLVHIHIQSYLHPLKMVSFYLRFLFFHIIPQFQEVLTFYVLKILKNLHLNLVHLFSYVECFVMHQQLLLLLFCVHI